MRHKRWGQKRREKKRERERKLREHYDILQVDPDCDREEIESAFWRRAKEVHPNNGGSVEEFRRLEDAYGAVTETKFDKFMRRFFPESSSDELPPIEPEEPDRWC